MAKTAGLPSVDNDVTQEVKKNPPQTGTIVPVTEVKAEGYIPRRIDVKLTRDAAIKLRDKTRELQDSGAKTADGRFVTNRTQAVQWIFENEVVA